MAVIFVMSSRAGESDKSGGLLNGAIAWASPTFYHTLSQYQLECLNYGFRKTCHVTEYAILALLFMRALRSGQKRISLGSLLLALFCATLYACTDEFHQRFVPGRTASLEDVLIDSVGALLALILAGIYAAYRTLENAVNMNRSRTPGGSATENVT